MEATAVPQHRLLFMCTLATLISSGLSLYNGHSNIQSAEQELYDSLTEAERTLIHYLYGAKSSLDELQNSQSGHHSQDSYYADYGVRGVNTYADYGERNLYRDVRYYDELQPIQDYDPDEGGYGQHHYATVSKMGYGYKPKKPRKKYVSLPKKREKKMKIISVDKGFYIPGGTQMFGKFKTLKGCMKACAATPNCFAGDYNPWFGRCYVHSNLTACSTMRAHKKLIHFKKVPCTVPETSNGRLVLGAQLFRGLEQKGIKSLTECIKKCANAGGGIPEDDTMLNEQICFGVDYDFSTHRCYFHVDNENPDNRICLENTMPPNVPRDLVANPSTVYIALCPPPP